MRTVRFFVPGPVRGKGRPRFATRGKFVAAYTDKKTADYELLIKRHAFIAMCGAAPMKGPINISMTAHFEPPKSASAKQRNLMISGTVRPTVKPDIDNILKMMDALNGVCFEDDKQVVHAFCQKKYASGAGLEIVIDQFAPQDMLTETKNESPALQVVA